MCGWIISSQLDEFRLEVEDWIPAGRVSAGGGHHAVMLSCRFVAGSNASRSSLGRAASVSRNTVIC